MASSTCNALTLDTNQYQNGTTRFRLLRPLVDIVSPAASSPGAVAVSGHGSRIRLRQRLASECDPRIGALDGLRTMPRYAPGTSTARPVM